MSGKTKAKGDVQHLDHFVVAVMEPERAEKFYTEVIGARTLKSENAPKMTRIFMKLGENHVGLFSQGKNQLPKRESANSYPRHSFQVPEGEYDGMVAKIRRAGVFVRTSKRKAVWVAVGKTAWCFKIPKATFSRSPKPPVSPRPVCTICTLTARISTPAWSSTSVFSTARCGRQPHHGRSGAAVGAERDSEQSRRAERRDQSDLARPPFRVQCDRR